jgi:hypothetical protein
MDGRELIFCCSFFMSPTQKLDTIEKVYYNHQNCNNLIKPHIYYFFVKGENIYENFTKKLKFQHFITILSIRREKIKM